MKSQTAILFFLIILAAGYAQNPIITHLRTADPSAHVWEDGKIWIYASHDQDDATNYDTMDGYHVFSSSDMVNWTDHGEVLHSRDVSWGVDGFMWAPDCAYKDGTYYFYFPHKLPGGAWVTGVATSDKPEGPFTDVGDYIHGTSGIDPCCFIDDDGQAYLYFGYYQVAKLKENMIELAESPRTIDYGASNFNEGAWVYKRNGIYYYTWSNWQDPNYQGFYSTGSSPYGPFEYKGAMCPRPDGAQDHHSIVEYCGQWYYFYHVGDYNGGSGNRRNVCVDYLYYNADGTIQMVNHTDQGVAEADCGPSIEITFDSLVTASDLLPATLAAAVADYPNPITSVLFEVLDDDVDFPQEASYNLTDITTDNLAPTALFTADTEGLYKFRLTVSDGTDSAQALAQVELYEDACQAQKNAPGGWTPNVYDRNEDCTVDLIDLSEFVTAWCAESFLVQQENYAGPVVYVPAGSTSVYVEAESVGENDVRNPPVTDNTGMRIENKSSASGGQAIGYTGTGDWAEYNVSIPAGTYTVTVGFGYASSSAQAHFGTADDPDLYGIVNLHYVGSTSTFEDAVGTLTFPQTVSEVRITWASSGFNFDYFSLSPQI